ncbi:MAG: CDP-alcohol phosphatidyltransferase family protein [Candidatus Limnocylindria bacterium]
MPRSVADRARVGLGPIARALLGIGVTADGMTVLGAVLTLGGAILLAAERPGIALAFLLAGAAADTLDGLIARAAGGGTRAGAFLDSTLDRISDAAVLGAAIVLGSRWDDLLLFWSGLVALVGSFMVSYVRAKAESLGLRAAVGVAPREARLVLLLLGVAAWAALDPRVFVAAVVAVALLSMLTLLQRVAAVATQLRSEGR